MYGHYDIYTPTSSCERWGVFYRCGGGVEELFDYLMQTLYMLYVIISQITHKKSDIELQIMKAKNMMSSIIMGLFKRI